MNSITLTRNEVMVDVHDGCLGPLSAFEDLDMWLVTEHGRYRTEGYLLDRFGSGLRLRALTAAL